MELLCSNCRRTIPADQVNVQTDLAKCPHCNSLHRASELNPSVRGVALPAPPAGATIQLQEKYDGSTEIFLPARGLKGQDIFQVFFLLFWFGFITVWTLGAASGSTFFALFSIPFWIAGLVMAVNLSLSIQESQMLVLTKDKLTLFKYRPFRSKRVENTWSDIRSISNKPFKAGPFQMAGNYRSLAKNNRSQGLAAELPAIQSGAGTTHFFEGANEAEQEWVMQYLEIARLQQMER
ncbi:MAG: hypothetical protein KDC54_13255 [Lewinella sp.]|nr:hypothetical protein [Lewinella sp.]